jgi:predicted ABC-type ATPase
VPQVIIVAGPNGAGKTTFANQYPPRLRFDYVNADEIARKAAAQGPPDQRSDVRAARTMLERIDKLAAAGASFMFETTLATRTYARSVPIWRRSGYSVSLIYLRLPSVEDSVARVQRRVTAGGHDIPPETIRRRFEKSAAYFERLYKSIVDEWYVYDSLEGEFVLKEAWDRS